MDHASRAAGALAAALGLLATALLTTASPAHADTATLVMKDVCEDPAAAFDYEWSRVKHGSSALFFMASDGTVSKVTADADDFDSYDTLYVAAHGGSDNIGGMSHGDFATNLKAAHDTEPAEMFFAVCSAAKGDNSLLKKVNAEYDDAIKKLSGGESACALVGDGSTNLNDADYLIDVGKSDGDLYDTVLDNIVTKWGQAFPDSEDSYQTVCEGRINPFNRANVEAFVTTALEQFSQDPESGDPEDSENYLDLVKLNDSGNALTVCGADPENDGEAVDCP